MQDQAHVFGRLENLVGVYTPPKQGHPQFHSVVVVMVTPGMLHHVGPFGLHVELARALAEQGIASFRFCLSGIGESFGVGEGGTSTQRATNEIRDAITLIEKTYGKSKVLLFGLCSGADDSVNAAIADSRVAGICLMDGCGFKTRGYHVRRWTKELPRRIRTLFVKRFERWRDGGSLDVAASTLPVGDDIREFPGRQQAEDELHSLVARGVRCLFLYTGGVSGYFNSLRQFGEMFPRLSGNEKIEVEYYPQMDHIARLVEDREAIVCRVTQWMAEYASDSCKSNAPSNLAAAG